MKENPNTGLHRWAKILESATFLRWKGSWYFWRLEGSFENYKKNNEYSVLRMNFFDQNPEAYLSLSPPFVFSTSELRAFLGDLPPVSVQWSTMSEEPFRVSFEQIQNKFQNSELRKAVPISFQEGILKWEKSGVWRLVSNLLDAPETLIPYGFWTPNDGFVGATPEILFEAYQGRVESMALAGTASKKERQAKDLLTDKKELSEHDFVVQEILESLQNMGDFKAEPLQVLELPTLWHLLTPIRGKVSNVSPFDLVKALHPTPALGVFPRKYGWQWLQDLPLQKERGSFGAPLVFRLGSDHCVALVCLRRIEWKGDRARIFAGCGLVKQSHFDREWLEIQNKIDSVKKVLRLESL